MKERKKNDKKANARRKETSDATTTRRTYSNKTQEAHNMSSAFKLWSLLNIIYIIILPHRIYKEPFIRKHIYMQVENMCCVCISRRTVTQLCREGYGWCGGGGMEIYNSVQIKLQLFYLYIYVCFYIWGDYYTRMCSHKRIICDIPTLFSVQKKRVQCALHRQEFKFI